MKQNYTPNSATVNPTGHRPAARPTIPIDIPQEKFWSGYAGAHKIDPESLHKFLQKKGFFTYHPKGTNSRFLVRYERKKVSEVSIKDVRKSCWDYIDTKYSFKDAEERKQIKSEFHRNRSLFSKDNLDLLPGIVLKECQDTKDKSYLFFKDCYLVISADSITVDNYDKLDGFVFKTDVTEINFREPVDKVKTSFECPEPEGEFYEFIKDLTKNENKSINAQSLESMVTIIGYLVHRYKDPANAKAIIFMDTKNDGNANGGTGKSLLTKGISHVRESAFQDGKYFTSSDRFVFSNVKYGTRILIIDDVPKNFDFEKIFPLITEKAVIERKYENKFVVPFEESPKVVLTTNYTVEGKGNSHKRRKVEFILSDTYSDDNTPEDKFGHLLFIEWDHEEWRRYYNFIVYCIQQFLRKGIVMPSFNVALRRLKMEATPQFIDYVHQNIEPGIKTNKQNTFNDFFSKHPDHHRIELTTFRNWLSYFADAYGYDFIESHSGNDNFFEYSLPE